MIQLLTLRKEERLNSKIAIGELFEHGESFIAYPLRFIYRSTPVAQNNTDEKKVLPSTVLISVSKRYFKRAVKRNLIKRQIREAYRLNKHPFISELSALNKTIEFGVLYVGKEVMSHQVIEKKMLIGLNRIVRAINEVTDETTL